MLNNLKASTTYLDSLQVSKVTIPTISVKTVIHVNCDLNVHISLLIVTRSQLFFIRFCSLHGSTLLAMRQALPPLRRLDLSCHPHLFIIFSTIPIKYIACNVEGSTYSYSLSS